MIKGSSEFWTYGCWFSLPRRNERLRTRDAALGLLPLDGSPPHPSPIASLAPCNTESFSPTELGMFSPQSLKASR